MYEKTVIFFWQSCPRCGEDKKQQCDDCSNRNHGAVCGLNYNRDDCCTYPEPACFPASARVSLENGKSIQMSELKVGDKVQTGI